MSDPKFTEPELRRMAARVEASQRWLSAMMQHMYLLLLLMWLAGFTLGVVVGKTWWAQ